MESNIKSGYTQIAKNGLQHFSCNNDNNILNYDIMLLLFTTYSPNTQLAMSKNRHDMHNTGDM